MKMIAFDLIRRIYGAYKVYACHLQRSPRSFQNAKHDFSQMFAPLQFLVTFFCLSGHFKPIRKMRLPSANRFCIQYTSGIGMHYSPVNTSELFSCRDSSQVRGVHTISSTNANAVVVGLAVVTSSDH